MTMTMTMTKTNIQDHEENPIADVMSVQPNRVLSGRTYFRPLDLLRTRQSIAALIRRYLE